MRLLEGELTLAHEQMEGHPAVRGRQELLKVSRRDAQRPIWCDDDILKVE